MVAASHAKSSEAHKAILVQPKPSRPIDMAHLARQTMGDRALEQEVLYLFVRQAQSARLLIAKATPDERYRLAHTLKGSARSVGAFALADCLGRIEDGDKDAVRALPNLVSKVCDFVAAIGR